RAGPHAWSRAPSSGSRGPRPRGRSHGCPRRRPCGRRPPGKGGRDRATRGTSSGRDAGPSVPDDGLHPIFGHQLQLLQLANSPLLVRRERAGAPERLELLVVGLVLAAEAPEFLVLGSQSLDERLLVPACPL